MEMDLAHYLEEGIKKAGTLTALGFQLGMSQPRMSKVKSKVEHLPLDAAIKLADYIGADRIAVISANELATEKKPEKREFWGHLLATQTVFDAQGMRFTSR